MIPVDDEIRVPVTLPLDTDGFLRRKCPTCEQHFKWHVSDDSETVAEEVYRYYCPLCGEPAPTDGWATDEQIEHMLSVASPDVGRAVQDALGDAFKGSKAITFEPNRDFALDLGSPEPLVEPDDMVAVQPPCHPDEPVKVPETTTQRVHCLICGGPFAA